MVSKRLHSDEMLRHFHFIRSSTDYENTTATFEFFLQHSKHLTGVRGIDWYFMDRDSEPLKALMPSIAGQIEYMGLNNTFESGFYEHLNPKVVKSLELVSRNVPSSLVQQKFGKLESLRITTDDQNYAAEFVSSLDSVVAISIYTTLDLADIDMDKLADAIRRFAATNPNLRSIDIDQYERQHYEFVRMLVMGRSSSEHLPFEDVERVEELFKSRLGIAPQVLRICRLNVWSVFYFRTPADQFRQMKNNEVWLHWFNVCLETASDKFFELARFMVRICDPEIFPDEAFVDHYIDTVEKTFDVLLALERRFDPNMQAFDTACTLLHWGGLLLMRHKNDLDVRKRVVERCTPTLQSTPFLLTLCADGYLAQCDMEWLTSPGVHCVFELAEWYDPTTLVLKDEFVEELLRAHQLFLAMAIHPKFNPDVKIDDNEYLCRYMLQALFDNFVDPDNPSYDAGYLALAKMCDDRNLKINITSKLSSYSMRRIFASDEILSSFSRVADDLCLLCEGPEIARSTFGFSEPCFRGIAFMLKKMEERGEPDVARFRRTFAETIWKGMEENRFAFTVYSISVTGLEHVFAICPELPERAIRFIRDGAPNRAHHYLTQTMRRSEILQKYLPDYTPDEEVAPAAKDPSSDSDSELLSLFG
jgi:hypothetical protein